MIMNDRFDHAKSVHAIDPRAVDAVGGIETAASVGSTASTVCYCGHYEDCPHWDEMTVDERRACSADKRMTVESLWKAGVRGA
jgi:hypothetical protein